MKEEEKVISFRDILYTIFKWKRFIIITFSVILLAAAIFTFFSPPVYEATAKVLLKRERPDIINLTTDKSDGIRTPISSKDIMAEIEIIKNRSVLENVAKAAMVDRKSAEKKRTIMAYILTPLMAMKNSYYRIHSQRELSDLEENVLELTKNLKINEVKNSDIFAISYESENPEKAKQIVNALTNAYIDYRLNLYKASQANEFFQNKLTALERNLKESKRALRSFQEQNNAILSGDENESLITQLSTSESALRSAEIEEEELDQKIAFLKGEMGKRSSVNADSQEVPGAALKSMKEQLLSLQIQRSELLQKYTQSHPQVVSVEREIKALESLIKDEEGKPASESLSADTETKEFLSKELVTAEAQLTAVSTRKKALKEQVNEDKSRLANNQNQLFTLKELEKKVESDEEAYNLFLDKLKESEVFLELDKMKVTNATILNFADTPLKPIKPKKAKNMLMAAIIGLVVSLGLVFGKEYFNHGLKNQEDVERILKIKVLASFPLKNVDK